MSGIRKGALLLVILSILNVLLLAADDTGTHDYSINLNEGANLRGVAQVYVSGSEGAVFTLKVNDAVLLPSEKEPEIRMIYREAMAIPIATLRPTALTTPATPSASTAGTWDDSPATVQRGTLFPPVTLKTAKTPSS